MENKKCVLVTGGTGYIGSWVVKFLLEKGYSVRVTVRDKSKGEKFKHLLELAKSSPGEIEIFEANLLQKGDFDVPSKGCETVYHIASPFLFGKIKNPKDALINPALEGTINVLNAATKSGTVKRVVLTSSVVAIFGDNIDLVNNNGKADESHWNTTSNLKHNPYNFSKVLAEKEAWKIQKQQNQWNLVVINPSFVMGPSLTDLSNTGSIPFLLDFLNGKNKMGVPELYFSFVDVRDVAKAHILAGENQAAKGRNITANRTLSMLAFAQIIERILPGKYPLPKSILPKLMLYLVGWTQGISWKFIKNNVGIGLELDNTKVQKDLGLKFRPIEETLSDHIQQLEKSGKI